MQAGPHALITAPSIIAIIPLFLYIIMSLRGKNSVSALIISVTTGVLLLNVSLVEIGKGWQKALGQTPVLIGSIIMLGTGLGLLMTKARVTHTLVLWIIKLIGVNTRTRAKVCLIVCSTLVCGLLGTLGGGNAIIAPLIIPIMAQLGITPTVTMVLLMVAGQIGLVIGPTAVACITTLGITGLSYGEYMLYTAGPYCLFWIVFTWIGANRAQKNTEGVEAYEVSADMKNIDEIVVTKKEKITTIAFLVTFIGLIAWGIMAGAGTSYAVTVMLLLCAVISICSGIGIDETVGYLAQGVAKNASRFLLYVFFVMMTTVVNLGGGFDALSALITKVASGGGATGMMIIASFVGGFGIEAATAIELQLIADMFMEVSLGLGLPMVCFATVMMASNRLTGNLYPTSNFVGEMAIAQCDNTKEALKGLWWGCAGQILWVVIYAFIGPMLLG